MDGLPTVFGAAAEGDGLGGHQGGGGGGGTTIDVEGIAIRIGDIQHHVGDVVAVAHHRGGELDAPAEVAARAYGGLI